HDLADDAGALEVAAVRPVAAVVHGVQDPGVDRLQAVPHIRQRTADDDRHRVLDVAALHLDLDVDRLRAVVAAAGIDLSHVPLDLPAASLNAALLYLAAAARPESTRLNVQEPDVLRVPLDERPAGPDAPPPPQPE